jgi:diadenosine tetraphosphate (Ap4A) HIT family hydrolase
MTGTERLALLERGENPKLLLRMRSGFAVIGDTQFLPGYSLLLAYPEVGQLNDLHGATRDQFLRDMAALGDAVKVATGADRINYSVYGNLDPFLHAHVWPRYVWESDDVRTMPPFNYPPAIRDDPSHIFDMGRHGGLMRKIKEELERRV